MDFISDLFEEEVEDPEEECFLLFSSKPDNRVSFRPTLLRHVVDIHIHGDTSASLFLLPNSGSTKNIVRNLQDLGFVSRTDSTLSVSVNSQEYTIYQSPSLLTSTREAGTTGAVLWKVTPLLAGWLTNPANKLTSHVLKSSSTAVELGAGTSGILALSLSPYVANYIATDQEYCLKLLRKNIVENFKEPKKTASSSKVKKSRNSTEPASTSGNIVVTALDWELTDASSLPELKERQIDLVIAADCIYNESLVDSLVDTMAELCELNRVGLSSTSDGNVTLVMVAQELRSPDVLEAFLKAFCAKFKVWRVPDRLLKDCGEGGLALMEGGGYVVHIGILK
ncbi:hypothetical protein ABW19_dt0206522 [Dactylella cylindrospora]|nr:hypothetical protein ABW19_dt0206522 [Dactylella cylindrospora]